MYNKIKHVLKLKKICICIYNYNYSNLYILSLYILLLAPWWIIWFQHRGGNSDVWTWFVYRRSSVR